MKELSIEITNKCMNECIFCSGQCNKDGNIFMSFNTIKRVIEEAIDIGIKNITLSGGEPLLHPDIIEICKYSCSLGIKPTIYTSGIYKQKESIPLNLLLNISGYISKLVFNMPSFNPLDYYKLSGGTNIDILLKSIEDALHFSIDVEFNTIITKINLYSISDMIDKVNNSSVNKVNLLRAFPHGRLLDHLDIIPSDKEIDKIRNLNDYNIRIGIPLNKKCRCVAGYNKVIIKYDGYVFPCDTFKNQFILLYKDDKIAPKSINHNSLKDCINSRYFKYIKKEVSEHNKTRNGNNDACYAQCMKK